jgi:hypothetical protein
VRHVRFAPAQTHTALFDVPRRSADTGANLKRRIPSGCTCCRPCLMSHAYWCCPACSMCSSMIEVIYQRAIPGQSATCLCALHFVDSIWTHIDPIYTAKSEMNLLCHFSCAIAELLSLNVHICPSTPQRQSPHSVVQTSLVVAYSALVCSRSPPDTRRSSLPCRQAVAGHTAQRCPKKRPCVPVFASDHAEDHRSCLCMERRSINNRYKICSKADASCGAVSLLRPCTKGHLL